MLGTAAVLVALAAKGFRWALVCVVLFAAADLGGYGLSYAVYPHTVRPCQLVATVDVPAAEPDGRVVGSIVPFNEQGLQTGNQLTLAGWHRADGYAGLQPRRQLDYRCLSALRIAGVRWVKRTEANDKIEGLVPRGPRWLEVPRPLPRVRLVTRVATSNDPSVDIERIPVESTALGEVPLALPEGEPGTATLVAARPGKLLIEVDSPTPQLLVLSESFHPGWRATIDQKSRPVLRVNGDFMGCLVEPGQRRVVFEFRPCSLQRGWIASCSGLGLILVCYLGSAGASPSRCRFRTEQQLIRHVP